MVQIRCIKSTTILSTDTVLFAVPIEDRLAVWADLFSAGMNAFELYKKNQCPRS
jgi:hypothetical protein